jgi:hypothetical protein
MPIQSRQELAEYALRTLGAPVHNIEVTDEQLDDAIELSVQYYIEFHFDGIERDYLLHQVTGTKITLASPTGWAGGGTIQAMPMIDPDTDQIIAATTFANIIGISGSTIITSMQTGFRKFQVGDTVTNGSATTTITAITLGDVDNRWIPVPATTMGVKKILNITSVLGSADYMFNVNYQIMMAEIQNLTSAGTAYFYGVQQFLGHLDYIMKKEKDFRFNRRAGQLWLDISWSADVKVGDVVVAEVYRSSDDETYPLVLNDLWMKKYATSQVKLRWGNNLKKYEGMELPGGLKYSGQKIYDEALTEIAKLEDEAVNSGAPLEFLVG